VGELGWRWPRLAGRRHGTLGRPLRQNNFVSTAAGAAAIDVAPTAPGRSPAGQGTWGGRMKNPATFSSSSNATRAFISPAS